MNGRTISVWYKHCVWYLCLILHSVLVLCLVCVNRHEESPCPVPHLQIPR